MYKQEEKTVIDQCHEGGGGLIFTHWMVCLHHECVFDCFVTNNMHMDKEDS